MRFDLPVSKICRCGSGLPRHELTDALGIFCAFVCEACEPAKRRAFNPAIFDAHTYPPDEAIDDD